MALGGQSWPRSLGDLSGDTGAPERPASLPPPHPAGAGPPEMWRARVMAPGLERQHRRLTLAASLLLLGALLFGAFYLWVDPGVLVVTLALVALFGLPVWVASGVMGADHRPGWYEPEHRVLLTDVDDLLGRDLHHAEVVSRLPRDTVVSLGQRRTGELCLYALGLEHPLTPLLALQIRAASRPAEPSEVEARDEALARQERATTPP